MLEIIREYSFDVNFETGKFKRTDGSEERIKLVQNDNESTKFKFNFEEEIADNTNVLVRLRQSTGYVKEYTMLIQNQKAEIILTNDILSESGSLTMSITLIGTDDEILTDTEYHSKMYVLASLEGNTEIPVQEKSVLVDLISQVNSLNQTASQLVEDTEAAVTNSNTVLANAETALQNANTATSNANQAAQNANNAVTELDDRLATKVDKVNGKGLSTNDYDNAEKEKNETNRTEILRRALITETGNKIDLEINNQTYILTAKLYDKNNNLISTSTSIDLPLETMIVNATYNNTTKKIVLTLQSGTTVEFSIADLIDGLVNETTFNETIEELEAENTRLKQRVADLENNELTNTVSGESIDIDDSANATIRNIKITGKSIQDGTPTPENPIEIQNCSGSINFKAENKNVFYATQSDFLNGVKDGEARRVILKLKPNTQYTCSSNDSTGTSIATNIWVNGGSSASDGVFKNNPKTTMTDENGNLFISIRIDKIAMFFDGTFYIQIEEGDTATDYVAHEEQNITFPLQEGQVLAQDDYLADDGIHHVRKQVVLDGTENWTSRTNIYGNLQFYCSTPKNNIVLKDQKCNYGKFNSTTYNYGHYGDFYITNVGSSSQFFICVDENETIESFKAKLQANNLVCEYPLNQETIEPYTEQQAQAWEQIKALRTYKNITHISSEDETKPTLEVTYVRDLQTVINNMQAQILS